MGARPSRPALGRGLSALLGDIKVAPPGAPAPAGTALPGLRQIPLDLLDPNPFQPRMAFDQEALEELAASIRLRGVLQPILARAHPTKPDRFYIVAGERRWRAAGLAGLHEVPAIVRDMTDAEAGIAALIENLQREDLNPIEEAEGYSRLLDELELTQEKLAEAVGKSRTHITNILRLLNLPPAVQTEVRKGTLTFGHARALLAHPDPETLAATVSKGGLTVRQTEALAARGASGTREPGGRRRAGSADMAALEQRLVERLGFQARVSTGRQGRVSVVLDFTDLHQLEAWMEGMTP
ncbi:MAG TPA: ParB/RepB/Spo0J family partition protein [Acetobacteraceae bacterium]|jgi:ParB family transcriptional regulator, chromosome partitioning protein|nr:ParB/RepB/Spo0J family partition protein [Acetobacteraceae bacterium]